ncbi:MAG: EAL domain-containing protein [Burkholderiaceae bacterium]
MPTTHQPTLKRHCRGLPHIAGWLVVAVLITVSWLHVCSLIAADRTRTIADAEHNLANLTRVTQEHAERTFRSADQALHFVIHHYEKIGDKLDLKLLTQQGVIDTDIFNQVGIIDADGKYRLGNLPFESPMDLSDREHFWVHLAADTGKLFISKPVLGRASGKWSIQLSRRINRKDGSFGGVAVVSLDPGYFTRFYGDLDLGHGGMAAMFGLDGMIRARRAGEREDFGIDASSSTLMSRIDQGQKSGAATTRSVVDGVERILFFRKVTPYPIAVIAGITSTDVLSAHLQARNMLLWQASIASLLILVLGMVFSYHQRQIRRDILQRKRTEQQLRIAAAAFESQEGMFVTDADKVIQRVNHAFTQITGYSAADAVGQTPKLLSSGRHDAAFYTAMEESIAHSGYWQGEIWNRRKGGEVYPQWLTITAVKDPAGEVSHYVCTLNDITLRKAAENEIRHLAYYDPLTLLPNRRLLLDRLHQALVASERSGHEGALLFIDLDNFKMLNDTLGHDKGDLLLQQVAQRLCTCVREGDTVARLGGDEFVVMLEDLNTSPQVAASQAKAIGEKILATLNQVYLMGEHVYHSSSSIGISLFNHHLGGVDELLKRADLAMYEAKAAGRNTLRFFDPDMQAVVMARAALEADLRQALQEHQFQLYYQPQVGADGRLIGAEALLRWLHPQRGLVLPNEFIPLTEETGLILPLGQWVLETACLQLKSWAAHAELAQLTLAVNISARQLQQPDFVPHVLATLERTGANPGQLKLELTESQLLKDVEDSIDKMLLLKAPGIHFALDDFGTGYSSLSYLKRLPLDQLKIDRSFVSNVLKDTDDAIIVSTIVALAHGLGLDVIAEGVETEAQRDFLAEQGCLAYQGKLFGKPMALAEFEQLLLPCAV